MLSKEKKLEITEGVVSSNTFKNAPTSIAILRYLVNAEIETRHLKEGIIDIEFFGAEPDTDKNNPRVRVNIYNLRNKLKSYYASEGVKDLWHIKIDKGQYEVRFEIQNLKKRISIPGFSRLIPYVLLFALAVVFVVSLLPVPVPLIWKAFFKNGYATNLYIGDAFGYGGRTISGLDGWTRDFSINSLDEYYAMLEQHPELKSITIPTEFFYATRMAENATHDLTHFFTGWNRDFNIKYATSTSFSDIKTGNTIYVGRMKDQQNFTDLFNDANPNFNINDGMIEFSGHETIPDTSIVTITDGMETDFTVVSRIPGPNDTEQFLFFSDHDIGVMATVEYFTNENSIEAFSKKYLRGSPYFTALFKARGKERINLMLETILVVPLYSDQNSL